MAANLGAKLTAPRLLRAMEGAFEGTITVTPHSPFQEPQASSWYMPTWLDVVAFAASNPGDFSLTTTPDGRRVCQFPMKNVQVEIGEDDWRLIVSGALDRFRLVPPHPLEEDEMAELATLDILEKRLQALIKTADEIAGNARRLNYQLNIRRSGIKSRQSSQLSSSTFQTAVQSPQPARSSSINAAYDLHADLLQQFMAPPPPNFPISTPAAGVLSLQGELAKSQQQTPMFLNSNRPSSSHITDSPMLTQPHPTQPHTHRDNHQIVGAQPPAAPGVSSNPAPSSLPGLSLAPPAPVSTPSPQSGQQQSQTALVGGKEDSQAAHRLLIQARIEKLSRGDQILPPCDRCRRLRTQCVKHLTACAGCTRKHAKCSWRSITEDEVASLVRDFPSVVSASVGGVQRAQGTPGTGGAYGGQQQHKSLESESAQMSGGGVEGFGDGASHRGGGTLGVVGAGSVVVDSSQEVGTEHGDSVETAGSGGSHTNDQAAAEPGRTAGITGSSYQILADSKHELNRADDIHELGRARRITIGDLSNASQTSKMEGLLFPGPTAVPMSGSGAGLEGKKKGEEVSKGRENTDGSSNITTNVNIGASIPTNLPTVMETGNLTISTSMQVDETRPPDSTARERRRQDLRNYGLGLNRPASTPPFPPMMQDFQPQQRHGLHSPLSSMTSFARGGGSSAPQGAGGGGTQALPQTQLQAHFQHFHNQQQQRSSAKAMRPTSSAASSPHLSFQSIQLGGQQGPPADRQSSETGPDRQPGRSPMSFQQDLTNGGAKKAGGRQTGSERDSHPYGL